MYDSKNDQALLNTTGLDHKTFQELVDLYAPYYLRYMWDKGTKKVRRKKLDKHGRPYRRKPRDMDAIGSLGLVLTWYRTRGSCTRTLSFIFGLTGSQHYDWLLFGRRVLLCILQKHPIAKVSLPTKEEVDTYTAAVRRKYPRMPYVWGAADGLKLHIGQAVSFIRQEPFYNSWADGSFVSAIFVFGVDGRIRICTINCPGSWHDSHNSDYKAYERIEEHVFHNHGGMIVVDSAFKIKQSNAMIKSSQEDPSVPELLLINRDATSIRQLSEWGMRMIQGQFPRLKDHIRYEEKGERRVILNLMVLLYNYQCSRVRQNQILNTFMHSKKNYYGSSQLPTQEANLNTLIRDYSNY